jgi:hypothetical protein
VPTSLKGAGASSRVIAECRMPRWDVSQHRISLAMSMTIALMRQCARPNGAEVMTSSPDIWPGEPLGKGADT